MPRYVKFLKDILSKKRKLDEFETVSLTEECSAILQNKLPLILKDPSSFTIPCTIGNLFFTKALSDLGASINLMPWSIFEKLGLGECKPTSVTLQLAYRSYVYPRGIIEYVLFKVDKFTFPVDFIILDMEEDRQIQIILRRPFLATARALIDVEKGELTLRVQDQQVTFNIFKASKLPMTFEDYFFVSVVNNFTRDVFLEENPNDPLEACLVANSDRDDDEFIEYSNLLNAHSRLRTDHQFESLDVSASLVPTSKPSIEEPPTLELKPLPAHLRYAFLGKSSTLPVIIPAALTNMQKEKLLRTLREFKKAISSWVSPIQCVPKKGEMTVVANDNNDLILTRTVTRWRVCMDYRKLNKAIRKNHFPFPFIDQMLDRLAVGVVLGLRKDKTFHSIYYSSKTLNEAQRNYTTTEKELLVVVFSFDKFRSYLMGTKVIVYIDHSTIKYLIAKKNAKPRLIRWILLLQEFDLKIHDKKGIENQVADHLSRLEIKA
ncbi:Reverse transcriptase [Theobroma cacao]|nr:Reverse transcriptase [Theobroma cacao]